MASGEATGKLLCICACLGRASPLSFLFHRRSQLVYLPVAASPLGLDVARRNWREFTEHCTLKWFLFLAPFYGAEE